ncbi:MAG: nucleotide exchange factor GrpE [Bacteroidota bacterium]|nr:nucleotide exchange factor GrpE [Candidatus Kapabacteria bacterium]MDW8220100.1 nucleotide exchange factor GrpE [Bacteroidota bacterium]
MNDQNQNETFVNSENNVTSQETSSNTNATTTAQASDIDIEQLRRERDEFREISLRKIAELENFRRRTEQERQELILHANTKLLQKLLPVLDDMQRAVESGKNSNDYKALLEGVELVFNKALQIFKEAGVEPIPALGQQFDINLHEALMQMPSEAPEGQIIQEAQRGYMLGSKVLRHAKVIISAGIPTPTAAEDTPTAPAERTTDER